MPFNTSKMRGQIIGFSPPSGNTESQQKISNKGLCLPLVLFVSCKGNSALFTDKTLCLNNCNVSRDDHPHTSRRQFPKKRKEHLDQFFVCTIFWSARGALRKKLLPGGLRYKGKKSRQIIVISSLPNLGHPIPSCHRAL